MSAPADYCPSIQAWLTLFNHLAAVSPRASVAHPLTLLHPGPTSRAVRGRKFASFQYSITFPSRRCIQKCSAEQLGRLGGGILSIIRPHDLTPTRTTCPTLKSGLRGLVTFGICPP